MSIREERPAGAVASPVEHLAPSSSEEEKESGKEAGILSLSSQVNLIDGPPDFIAIFDLLGMPPSLRVCVNTHTPHRTSTVGARVHLPHSSSGRIPQLFQLSTEGRAGASVCQ